MSGIVDSEDACQKLQQDLERLCSGAEKCLMQFNTEKREVLHFGKSKQGRRYRVNGRALL